MLNFLASLIIAWQLIIPLQNVIMGTATTQYTYPHRRVTYSFAPLIEAKSALALDIESGKILFQKNAFSSRPIASITKLMTAMVFLKHKPKGNDYILITDDDKLNGGKILLLPGMKIKANDLLQATLIGSLNNGATALAKATDLGDDEFVAEMNRQASEWGLSNTHFVEPSGVSHKNKSTAMDVAKLLWLALKNSKIQQALTTPIYSFYTQAGKRLTVHNTNELLKSYLDDLGGKTGYTDEAGYCLVNLVKNHQSERNIIVVILGAKTKADRFQESKFLTQWVFDNWQW